MRSSKAKYLFVVLAHIVLISVTTAAQQYSNETQAALTRGRNAYDAGKFDDAIKEYKEANKREHGNCSPCLAEMASTFLRLGKISDAEQSATKAITAAHDLKERVAAHNAKGLVLTKTAGTDMKKFASAESEFRTVLSEDAESPEAHFGLGLVLLKQSKDAEGKNEFKYLIEKFPTTVYARDAKPFVENPRRAREWFAPDFEAVTLQGEKIKLSQFQGKIVVLDFWATWCPPCRASIPEIKELLKKYPREKLVVISISADEKKDAWKDFVASKKMDWPQLLESECQVAKRFRVHGFPTYIVIDQEGVVRDQIVGLNERQSVMSRLSKVLAEAKELN